MKLVIELDRKYPGQKIVDAFRAACDIRESSDSLWTGEVQETNDGAQKVLAYPMYYDTTRTYWFYGPRRNEWVRDHTALIMVGPLAPDEDYGELELTVQCHCWCYGPDCYPAFDPYEKQLLKKDVFKKIMSTFHANLKNESA